MDSLDRDKWWTPSSPWRWSQQGPWKYWYPITSLHSITTQITVAMKTSNLIW